MFVKNKGKVDLKYRAKGVCVVLKAGVLTLVDDTVVMAKELIACYGQRIEVIGRKVEKVVTKKASVKSATTSKVIVKKNK